MVFVADVIPPELQRIVEFLNGQMDPAEVLAVEVRQYVGQGQRAMVPRVLGQTASAQQKKGAASTKESRQWDEASFFETLQDAHGPAAANAGRELLTWARDRGLRIRWGNGRTLGSFYPLLDRKGAIHRSVAILTTSQVELQFGYMKLLRPFDDGNKRGELQERLNTIPGVNIPPDAVDRWPKIPLSPLTNHAAMQQFLGTLDWFIQQVTDA
jgi:hypothetical protein